MREEFITTLKREELPDEMVIHQGDKGINEIENFDASENTPKNDTGNFGVNETQKQIIKFISENPQITAGEMAYKMKQPNLNIVFNIKVLKTKGIIERYGSDKTGGYRIKK